MSLVAVEQIDKEAILRSLNLNPRDPKTQALLLVCDRYKLDPLLKHLILIQGNAYITRDGYLAIAHRSGQFDGMEVLGEGETTTHFWARVAVWRRDMGHPFTYTGRYKKAKGGVGLEYGPEMAIKCAEVMGLRRAFNVTGVGAADERWDNDEPVSCSRPELVTAPDHAPDGFGASEAGASVVTAPQEPSPPCLDDNDPALVVKRLRLRVRAMSPAAQRAYDEDAKKYAIPAFAKPAEWSPEQIATAINLIEQMELNEQARVSMRTPSAIADYGEGEEPF